MRAAWWALRGHLEARLASARTAGLAEQVSGREEELKQLEAMWHELGLQPPEARRERWLLGWAAAASLVACALAVALLASDGGPRALIAGSGSGEGSGGVALEGEGGDSEQGGSGGSDAGETVAAAGRARLVANAEIEGAQIEIEDTRDGVVVARGPADETAYWLAPGRYTLRVAHADCDGRWEHTLEATAGDVHALAPDICDATAWLIVQTNVEGAHVRVDDLELGAAGPSRHAVEPGEREIRVAKAGYTDWEGIVELAPRRELTLKPRLTPLVVARDPAPRPLAGPSPESPESPQSPPPPAAREAADRGEDPALIARWDHETRQWLLARYDTDRSGEIDSSAELDAIPCDQWQGIERSYNADELGLSMTRFYGFDGEGWKPGSLGMDSSVRDLAFNRMRECGLRY